MPAKTKSENLYKAAVLKGTQQYQWHTSAADVPEPVIGPTGPGYWIARHAAQQTALALLKAASVLNLTHDQYEGLRQVAETVTDD